MSAGGIPISISKIRRARVIQVFMLVGSLHLALQALDAAKRPGMP